MKYRLLRDILSKYCSLTKTKWDEFISSFLFSLKRKKHLIIHVIMVCSKRRKKIILAENFNCRRFDRLSVTESASVREDLLDVNIFPSTIELFLYKSMHQPLTNLYIFCHIFPHWYIYVFYIFFIVNKSVIIGVFFFLKVSYDFGLFGLQNTCKY